MSSLTEMERTLPNSSSGASATLVSESYKDPTKEHYTHPHEYKRQCSLQNSSKQIRHHIKKTKDQGPGWLILGMT